MSNIRTLNTDNRRPHLVDAGGGGPTDMELSERVAKIEAVLPNLVTKEDMVRELGGLRAELHKEVGGLRAEFHKEITAQTWRIIGFVSVISSALVAAVFFIAKNVH